MTGFINQNRGKNMKKYNRFPLFIIVVLSLAFALVSCSIDFDAAKGDINDFFGKLIEGAGRETDTEDPDTAPESSEGTIDTDQTIDTEIPDTTEKSTADPVSSDSVPGSETSVETPEPAYDDFVENEQYIVWQIDYLREQIPTLSEERVYALARADYLYNTLIRPYSPELFLADGQPSKRDPMDDLYVITEMSYDSFVAYTESVADGKLLDEIKQSGKYKNYDGKLGFMEGFATGAYEIISADYELTYSDDGKELTINITTQRHEEPYNDESEIIELNYCVKLINRNSCWKVIEYMQWYCL